MDDPICVAEANADVVDVDVDDEDVDDDGEEGELIIIRAGVSPIIESSFHKKTKLVLNFLQCFASNLVLIEVSHHQRM